MYIRRKHKGVLVSSKIVTYDFAELFCGPGGMSLGVKSAKVVDPKGVTYKINPIWANDVDENTCKTYAMNIHSDNKGSVYCGRVEDVDFEKVPAFRALAFGFPCNDFSLVGEQLGFNGKYGPLYTYGLKAIESHNPDFFIAENVGGLSSANNGQAFKKILHDLERVGKGYELTANLYKFEEYGVPQTRHRIVIVGIRKDIGRIFRVPKPSHLNSYVSSSMAIESPPINSNTPNNELTKQSAIVVDRLRHIPPGGNAWSDSVPEHLRLKVKGARLSQIYKRLDPNKPSYTVTGSGGGGTHVYHWSEPRALTNRERARIQTFPDNFVFVGSKESVRKQIGMAVPPLAAKIIAEAVLKTIVGVKYESVDANIDHKTSIMELLDVAKS